MKIIFSNYDDKNNPYYGGGGAIAIHEVGKRLAKKDKIMVITGKYPKSHDDILDNVVYKRIGVAWVGPKMGQLIFQLLLPFYVRELDFDIWLESFTPPFSTAFLQLFTKRPVIGLVHLLGGVAKSKQYKLPFYLIEQAGLSAYKNFIVLTESSFKKVKKYSPNSTIEIIPNGFLPSYLKKSIKKNREYILFIGRIEVEQKGLDLLLDAYKLVAHKMGMKLIIAGSGIKRDEQYVVKKIEELGLTKHIEYVGKVEGEEKERLIEQSAFIVLPSRFESFSIVVLEALIHRSPVVMFDIEDLSWVPADCSVRVKPFDVNKFSEAIITLSKNNTLRKKLGEKGRRYAVRFTWDRVAKKYSDYINKLSIGGFNNKDNDFKTPTISQTIFASVFSHFGMYRENRIKGIPKKIDNYKLIKTLHKPFGDHKYEVGIYKYKNNKFFIKTWRGVHKDLNYISLLNEYQSSRVLAQKIKMANFKIRFGEPISAFSSNRLLSVVYKYIEGVPLAEFDSQRQRRIYMMIMKQIAKLSGLLTNEEKKVLSKRTFLFYLVSLIFFAVLSIISHPNRFLETLIYVKSAFVHSFSLLHIKTILAHRDLAPQNIIIANGLIHILDCEKLVMTPAGYDVAYLALHENVKLSFEKIYSRKIKPSYFFYLNYLAVHLGRSNTQIDTAKSYIKTLL